MEVTLNYKNCQLTHTVSERASVSAAPEEKKTQNERKKAPLINFHLIAPQSADRMIQ